MTLTLSPVTSRKDKRTFINLPWLLHSKTPDWVPSLRRSVNEILDTENHPFYKDAELGLWLAYRGKQPVGRIAGIINHNHNRFHNEKIAFWGFFETENNVETARALFAAVETWVRQYKVNLIRGPMNPSINYECGLQISAFETPPFIKMTQNPSYYVKILESLGYQKAKDLHAWLLDLEDFALPGKLANIVADLNKKQEVTVRNINPNRYHEEIMKVLAIYNDAWATNWGYVPMSQAESEYLADEIRQILTPGSIKIVEVLGEIAAFGVLLLDFNQILARIRNGKLFPTGLLKLLWYTKLQKKAIHQGRIPILGIKKEFQHLHLGAVIYDAFAKEVISRGFKRLELSWVLEDNKPLISILEQLKARQYKTYRIYEKPMNLSSIQ